MPATEEAVATALRVVAAAEDIKASDPSILEVADVLALVDLFVLVSASNERQLKAVVEEVERQLGVQEDRRPLRREGSQDTGWMLLDYGDVVLHAFLPETRGFYDLERLWADVPGYDPHDGTPVPPSNPEAAGREGLVVEDAEA